MWNPFTLFRSKPLTVAPNEARIYQMPPRHYRLTTAPTAQGAVKRMRGQVCEVLPIHPNDQR